MTSRKPGTADNAPITNWSAIASSTDGHRLVAAVYAELVYTLQSIPKPKLKINTSDDPHPALKAARPLLCEASRSLRICVKARASGPEAREFRDRKCLRSGSPGPTYSHDQGAG